MSEELIKAIWAAGFRTGHDSGSDSTFCFEHGSRSRKPQDAEKAWSEELEWRLKSQFEPKTLDDVSLWEGIP